MFNLIARLLFLSALLASATAKAEDPQKLIAKYNCLACHSVNQKIVGPSYKAVAAKYRGQKEAEALLMKEIRSGVSGKWGAIPMPPQQISDADLRVIVKWILTQ